MDIKNNKPENQNESTTVTPRQALIYAALVGWKGDEPSPWFCPVAIDDILAWAKSHFQGTKESLITAFKELETEGLFFEIHKGVFDPPCYFCSYKTHFLNEISDGKANIDYWSGVSEDYDEEYGLKTWRTTSAKVLSMVLLLLQKKGAIPTVAIQLWFFLKLVAACI